MVFSIFATVVVAASPAPCEPLPGMAAVLAVEQLEYLLIGEYHGTREMPEVASQAACSAVQSGRPVVLAIEFPPENQPHLDVFIRSDGKQLAVDALLKAPAWTEEGGRTTQAIVDLLESARLLRAAGKNVSVVAFDKVPTPIISKEREAAMAQALMEAQRRVPASLVIALTGAGHAGKTPWSSQNPPFASTGQLLPVERTLSFTFARPGGAYWGCSPPNGGTPEGCRAYEMPVREPVPPRGIRLDPTAREGFDGIYSAGRSYQASRPARGGG